MTLAVLVVAYLLGSIPFGLVIGKLWAQKDVRQYGSGNIGVSNVLRTVGPLPALLVLIGDAGKGTLAVLLAMRLADQPTTWLLAGAAAVAGHNWPIFLRFKGGRGVATSAGVLIALAPLVTLILFLIWVATLAISRYISLSSMMAAIALPILIYWLEFPTMYLAIALLLSFFTIYRHVPNIQRLLSGTEYKFGEKGRRN